jgi:hypothetical protein
VQSEALALIADWSHEEREYLRDNVPRDALATPFRGGTVQDLAKQVSWAQLCATHDTQLLLACCQLAAVLRRGVGEELWKAVGWLGKN